MSMVPINDKIEPHSDATATFAMPHRVTTIITDDTTHQMPRYRSIGARKFRCTSIANEVTPVFRLRVISTRTQVLYELI